MKRNLLSLFSIAAAALLLSATSTPAQEGRNVSTGSSKYVISAEAGAVNYLSGRVSITRQTGRSGYLLKGDTVKIGDRVATSENGKAEILLNPGSYIRLGGNSGFEFIDTSLENLQVKLVQGSAMFEVIASDDFTVAINTPKASFRVVKSGIYRVDVLEDGTGRLEVVKGKAFVGDDDYKPVSKGRSATVDGSSVAINKFDRGENDALENWSSDRAKELDRINDRLERQSLRNTLISGFGINSWNLYDSFGLWVYDPFWSSFCFLPFGYGWNSPYGYNFGRDIWWFRLPSYIYRQPPPRMTPTGTNNTTVDNGRKIEERQIVPPFEKIERAGGGGRLPAGRGDGSMDGFPTRTNPRIDPSPTIPETRQPTRPATRQNEASDDN